MAALLVAIALTMASVETFRVAADQYHHMEVNASEMRDAVVSNVGIQAMRVVSDIFIWLAQVQAMIRLFPRRKEKLIIKWFGFSLILLDSIFACLNSFWVNQNKPGFAPRYNEDAIPALNYLFELALGILFGAWVFYYVATKRRYAFFHADMPNISLVAILSIISILIPVGFFVADVAQPAVSGWGDFFRWVGAAAASVLVWEWVERIDLLEREEKRDGILGREVFEEDEIRDFSTSSDPSSRHSSRSSDSGFGKSVIRFRTTKIAGLADRITRHTTRPRRPRAEVLQLRGAQGRTNPDNNALSRGPNEPANYISDPQPRDGINRGDDNNTPSTIYAIHYHPIVDTPVPVPSSSTIPVNEPEATTRGSISRESTTREPITTNVTASTSKQVTNSSANSSTAPLRPKAINTRQLRRGATTLFPFRRSKKSPPLEIKAAMSLSGSNEITNQEVKPTAEPSMLKRTLHRLTAASHTDRTRGDDESIRPFDSVSINPKDRLENNVPTIIPAPPRGHTWSPDVMRHSPVNEHQMQIDLGVRASAESAMRSHTTDEERWTTIEDDQLGRPISDSERPRYRRDDSDVERGGFEDADVDDAASDSSVEYEISVSGLEEDEDEEDDERWRERGHDMD